MFSFVLFSDDDYCFGGGGVASPGLTRNMWSVTQGRRAQAGAGAASSAAKVGGQAGAPRVLGKETAFPTT